MIKNKKSISILDFTFSQQAALRAQPPDNTRFTVFTSSSGAMSFLR